MPPPSLGCDGGFLYTIAEPKNRGVMMTVEERLDQLEKRNRRLTAGLMMTVVAMCAVVTMAATGEKNRFVE